MMCPGKFKIRASWMFHIATFTRNLGKQNMKKASWSPFTLNLTLSWTYHEAAEQAEAPNSLWWACFQAGLLLHDQMNRSSLLGQLMP